METDSLGFSRMLREQRAQHRTLHFENVRFGWIETLTQPMNISENIKFSLESIIYFRLLNTSIERERWTSIDLLLWTLHLLQQFSILYLSSELFSR